MLRIDRIEHDLKQEDFTASENAENVALLTVPTESYNFII